VAHGTKSQTPLDEPTDDARPELDVVVGGPETDADAPSIASVASLEPALWKRLADAKDIGDVARAWLALQCQMIEGATRGIILLAGSEANRFEAVGFWPEGSGRLPALAEVAEVALRERRSLANPERGLGVDGISTVHVALPIMLEGDVEGAAAISVRGNRAEDGRAALRQLQWGSAWIRDRLRQIRGDAQQRLLTRSRTALELLGGALDHEGFDAAAMATVTGLALHTQCSRVSLGFRDTKHSTTVKVISHTAQFGQQMNLIRCLGAAMDEALDQRSVILYPNAEEPLATAAHAELSHTQNDGQVLTIPLLVGEHFVGAITFERQAGVPFEPATIELLEHVTAVTGPILEEKRRNGRWIGFKIIESAQLQLTQLIGPGHILRKLIVGALAVAVLLLTFVHVTYRVDADARIEGLVRRAVVAPYDGFIKEADARAGDKVEAGQVLATLEDRDLLLERLKWVTERQQHMFEYDKALATRQPATINVVHAQIDQDDAQIKLLDEQLARIKLRSSIAGLVISGDLSQMIGASVQRGQLLFEVAPLDSYRVILGVDEREIGRVEVGQKGDLIVSALPNETLTFQVDKITPIADAQAGRNVFRVEGRLTDNAERLRPGMEGIGKIEIGRRNLAWVWFHPVIDWLRIWSWHWLP
jgi:hypothetical protein